MGVSQLYLLVSRLGNQSNFWDKKSLPFGEAKLCKFDSPFGSHASSRWMIPVLVAALDCVIQHLASHRTNVL